MCNCVISEDRCNGQKSGFIFSLCTLYRSLKNKELTVGRLALYILALRSSCYDLQSLYLTGNEREPVLIHLKREMEEEKQNILCKTKCLCRRSRCEINGVGFNKTSDISKCTGFFSFPQSVTDQRPATISIL